jgi:alpha-tubulin suppressor-like RCC1 family protein
VAVTGGFHFRLVTAGALHSCALTLENKAYCWGANFDGQVGDGTTIKRTAPTAVAGGLRFSRIKSSGGYTCGLTTSDKTYCWGGTLVPVLLPGGFSFRQVTSGCGLTADRKAYCWGGNQTGRVGDGTTTDRTAPVAVAGELSYNQLVSGGVTTLNKAYCWGYNFTGALGDGSETNRLTPTAVLGGLLFDGVTPGDYHTCGVTTTGRAYCWGHNAYGQLGNGTRTGPQLCEFAIPCSRKPVAVVAPS